MTPDMAVKLLINAAEKNFKSNRLAEALVLANVANQIDHPKFEGSVAPYLAAYRVQAAAGRRKSGGDGGGRGEIDWHGVLGIEDAHAEIGTILGRYKQMVNLLLLLHPEDDKHSSTAAEGVIVFVSEACMRLLKSQHSSLRKSVPESASDQACVRRRKKAPRAFSDGRKKGDGRFRVRVRHQRRPITGR